MNPATIDLLYKSAVYSHDHEGALLPINYRGVDMLLRREGSSGGGSHKDRVAPYVVKSAYEVNGLGRSRRHAILLSSGNTAYAIAVNTAALGIRLHIVTDRLSVGDQLERLRAFGHVDLIIVDEPDPSGSHMAARKRAQLKLMNDLNGEAVVIDQYGGEAFPLSYEATLATEVDAAVADMAAVFTPIGTGALCLSFARFRQNQGRNWRVIPVDVPGSSLFPDAPPGKRVLPGIGNGIRTPFARQLPPDMRPVYVDPIDALRCCKWLGERRDLWLGPSSGAAIQAVVQAAHADALPHWGSIVVVCPDDAEAYRSTFLDDDWLIEHGLGRAVIGP